jgi:Xaa-Pro aminopeptidase
MLIADGLPISEFVKRRERVLKSLGGAVAVVFAGDGAPPLSGHWEPDWNFYYLTGIRDEIGGAVLFDPRGEDPKRRCILFLRPLNPEVEEWDGLRDRIGTALKKQTGFETVMRTSHLPRFLLAAARKRRRLACLHPFATHDAPVSHDLQVYRKVAERTIGVAIEDRSTLLPELRALKSPLELKTMQRAVDATAAGYDAALKALRPGLTEKQLQKSIEDGFIAGGADGVGYNSIVGSGLNGTVLHYMTNHAACEAGDLVVIDAGARVGGSGGGGYTADVTRTFPVSGRFSAEQREVYSIVLRALEAAVRAARPGAWMHDVDAAARNIVEKAGYGDRFPHGIGHQLGIEVHDVTPDGPLKSGMIVTIEPGIYLPDRRMGIRIEDDVLITARGPKVLTSRIPKTIDAIERAMRR